MMGTEPVEDALGDLDEGFVGRSHLYEPVVHVFTHNGNALDLSPYCSALETDKRWAAGTWEATVKARVIARGATAGGLRTGAGSDWRESDDHVDWFEELGPGDWAMIGFRVDRHTYPVMIGPVTGVHRTRQGLEGGEVWVISGGDHGYCLESHEIISLPQFKAPEGMDAVLADGAFYKTISRLTRVWEMYEGAATVPQAGTSFGLTPSDMIKPLTLFFLGHWRQTTDSGVPFMSGATPVWETPPIFPVDKPPRLPEGWRGAPLGDLLTFNLEKTDGRAVIQEAIAGLPQSSLWEYLRGWANPSFNEFWCDLLPVGFGQFPMTPDDYRRPIERLEAGAFPWDLAVNMRQKPFPSWAREDAKALYGGDIRDAPSGVDLWRDLASTTFDERQLSGDTVMVSDEHRKNFFLCLPHQSYGASPYTIALGAAGKGQLPVIAREGNRSARTAGWRRQEEPSKYLPTDGFGVSTYYLWSRLLADWGARGHQHLGGTLTTKHLYPGVRVGERVNVRRRNAHGTYNEFYYCEGVNLHWERGAEGADTAATSMTVTRGSKLVNDGLSKHPLGDDVGVDGIPLAWLPGERPI